MSDQMRPVLVLTTICVVCAALLATAQTTLGPRVERSTDLYVRGPALERLFGSPAGEILGNKATVPIGDEEYAVFFTRGDDGSVRSIALEATARGYGGDIVLLIGIDITEETLLGMEVVSHSETAGLGARMLEDSFREQWKGLPAGEEVALSAQGGAIDAITGATVTSGAVVAITNSVVGLLKEHKQELLAGIEAKAKEGGSG